MIRMDIKRTDFYNELPQEKQKEYFFYKGKKYLPAIDNIYYSVSLLGDSNENMYLIELFQQLEMLKSFVVSNREPCNFGNGLILDLKSYDMYKFCLSNPNLYDIFILSSLPNDKTPRIMVQVRAYGLWNFGVDKMLTDSYKHVAGIFEPLGCVINSCRENRVDYCYHTNAIFNPEKVLRDRNIEKYMSTSLKTYHQIGRIEPDEDHIKLLKDYFSIGNRKSNNVFIRIYNKALEVIAEGYKGFFFELWYQQGLISFYDKYCFQFALENNNYDYVHKAKLHFYLEYGIDAMVKKEFSIALKDINMTLHAYKNLADKYMPEVNTIMNIEYQTKRKFYYYSDEFIDAMLKHIPRSDVPAPLNRIFKITDNRSVFTDYLTSKTLCFRKKAEPTTEEVSEPTTEPITEPTSEPVPTYVYLSWWERLRNTKLDGNDVDEKLIRKYSTELDEKIARIRFINSVATNAVYGGNVESGFLEDITDLLSNMIDNEAHRLSVSLMNKQGKEVYDITNNLLKPYNQRKLVTEMRLKNRKKNDGIAAEQ